MASPPPPSGESPPSRAHWLPWRELAVLCLMLMELSWLTPWFRSLTPATYAIAPRRVFLVLGSITLITLLTARLMNYARLRMDLRRWVMVALFAISMIGGIKTLLNASTPLSLDELVDRPLRAFSDLGSLLPDEFIVSLMALVACWRGLSLARVYIEPLTVMRNFRSGVFMILAFVFVNTLVTGETPGELIYLFLFASLTAMGAARLSTLSALRGGSSSPFDRRWFIGMSLAALGVVALAALAAKAAIEGGLFQQIGALILGVFILVMVAIISPVIYFLPDLVEKMPGVSEQIGEVVGSLSQLRSTLMGLAGRLFEFLERSGLFALAPRLKPLLLWGMLIVVGLLILVSLSRWAFKERASRRDEHQSILSSGDLLRLLREAMQERLRKLGEGLAGVARLRQAQRLRAAARIRRIYAELMDLSEALGAPRLTAQTPLEFLPSLNQLFPALEADLATITDAYLRVRYGELPEISEEVRQVEAAWERVHLVGKERLKK